MQDFIIIGGGSAGCVLANRLSEDPACRVLLLEAGPTDHDPYIHMPVGFSKMTAGPLQWGYRTAPQKHCKNREIPFAQARVIGGGSSINAEVFTRGAPEDYDRWADEEGCPGWSYDEVQPLFLRMEDNDTFSGELHGRGGPLGVSTLDPHPMTRRFVQACQEAGIPYNPDFNARNQAGCGIYQTTTRGGRRCSAAVGYLHPVMHRANLEVRFDCTAHGIIVENGRAVGVRFERNGEMFEERANREILLASGAIGSPKLLMLSGIGPAAHLREHGIDVVHDLPGVGANLQDHLDVDVVYELHRPESFDKYQKPHWMLWAGLQYKLFNKGPVASNIVEGGAFWWADDAAVTPDLQFHFLAGAGVEAGIPAVASGNGLTLNTYFVRPRSRGWVTLRSADVHDAPSIDPNYAADAHDVEVTIKGFRLMRRIMGQPALADAIKGEHHPGPRVETDADIEDYVRSYGRTSYHPVGTCRMGSDALAVVDPQLRLRGIDGLRVCDSSIMPSLVSSNTNAATIMIGEKASDLIRGNH
ncbi:MAG: FAD-dependent oxidoreductase [Geminicoccaceae bacterium]